jgi:hypothetical protein
MRKGQIAYFVVPPELAYGHEGYGDLIPPDATLVFKIKVLAVKEPKETVCIDPIEHPEPEMPDFDRHTPGF